MIARGTIALALCCFEEVVRAGSSCLKLDGSLAFIWSLGDGLVWPGSGRAGKPGCSSRLEESKVPRHSAKDPSLSDQRERDFATLVPRQWRASEQVPSGATAPEGIRVVSGVGGGGTVAARRSRRCRLPGSTDLARSALVCPADVARRRPLLHRVFDGCRRHADVAVRG